LTARVGPSTLDRYDGPSPEETPSDRATFHLLVPAGGTATLTPVGNPLDLSIAELDPLAVRPVPACPAPARLEGMIRCDEVRWDGFVPRRPSNALLFEPAGTRLLRVAHRLPPVKAPSPPAPKLLRFQRPATATSIRRGGRIFAPAATPLELGFEGDRPVVVAVRLYSKEPVDVVAHVDGDAPIRRALGTATRITTPRLIRVQGEVLAIVVLGDDLSRGRHVLTFEAPKGEKVWVHVPWTHRIIDPHWVEGDFEESQ
jgi:hypothetical protein